ncbi:MAG: HAD family hydrolase [Chloracidobacterium sp.]|uniref:D,D-heptose 1,7-bisphosphate phosphatase n=1 Tax=Chloracidobacterium validum TaxID=2821543 RepID=A0ABX8BBL4_9BACT|nr:HAD family hydrolase [Chloracidobacterium validum]QUW03145.1 HAD family hydrolase [Chloracidobacterium validum]
MPEAPRRAIFFDRDGTLNEEVGYINHLSRFRLLPMAAAAVRAVKAAGWRAIVVTNQAGAARGYFPGWMIDAVHERLREDLAAAGAELDAVYVCPHHPTVGEPPYRLDCACRKPKPGLLLQAAQDFGLDLTQCVVIGDRYSDVQLAHRVGARGVLVLTGYGRGEYEHYRDGWLRQPDFIAEDALAAVVWALA